MVVRRRLTLSGPALVFVTTTAVDWMPVFADDNLARQVIGQLRGTAAEFDVSVCAYVLMPSHLHALVGLPQVGDLSLFMKSLKRDSARRIRDLLLPQLSSRLVEQGKYRLWRPKFDDLVVWSERQFKIKAEYIHNNPVKAGLVQESTEYEYSGARDWLLDQAGAIPIDKNWSWSTK